MKPAASLPVGVASSRVCYLPLSCTLMVAKLPCRSLSLGRLMAFFLSSICPGSACTATCQQHVILRAQLPGSSMAAFEQRSVTVLDGVLQVPDKLVEPTCI